MSRKTQRRYFSLIELIAVIAIGMILLGVVAVRAGRVPIFLSLDESARQIGNLLVTASRQASASGNDMTVVYDASERVFRIVPATSATDAEDLPKYSNSLKKKFMAYVLPDNIEIAFPELETRNRDTKPGSFYLFPDGTGSGPETMLKLRGKSIKLYLSPLTGSVIIDNPDAKAEVKNAGS